MKRLVKHITDLLKVILAIVISLFLKLSKDNRNIWLISERRDEAEDNGYFLYKYIKENHPSQKAFYIIDKKSPSYTRVKEYGTVIHHNSFKHFIYYFLAEKHLSAFQFFGVPETPIIWNLESLGLIKKKKIFLQHGITKERLPFLEYRNTKYNLFICGAKPEYDYIKYCFGYPNENVKYLGFCRFDALHDFEIKDQILLMPTWRQWFGMTNEDNNIEKEYKEFVESEYYKKYNSLLNNSVLNEFLSKSKIKLIFYPHPEMQRFLNAFSCNSHNIIIADRKKHNLQMLLKESKLLITDYSSIGFDFAYMKKPLIYYQFDQEQYYSSHFKKGYFDCERDGFGPVIKDENDLIEMIRSLALQDCINNKYIQRIDEFFPIRDRQNCYRHFIAISNI